MDRIRVVFFGTTTYSCAVFSQLLEEGYEVIAAVSQPDKKVGRKHELKEPPVKEFANDTEITGMKPDKMAIFRRRQIGIVYQFYNLIPILTAEENITLPIDLDRRKTDPAKLDEVLRTLGIEDKRRSLPNQLSGGQQQRVSIARAIITEPALLLADEPTGNLDSKATDDIVSLLKITNKTFGQTIVMITHDLDIAAQADRVLTISDGKLKEEVG